MRRILVHLATCCALVALALAPATAHAGDKGKSKRSAFSQSDGGGNPTMKLHYTTPRNLGGMSTSGAGASSLSKSLTAKSSKNFGRVSQGDSQSFQLYSGGKGGKGSSTANNLLANPSFNLNGFSRRAPSFDIANKSKLADAIQNGGNFPGIGSGGGNGDNSGPGFDEKFCKTPNKDKDCHHDNCFPWWTIGVGGCYPNNYPNDCHDHHCHNHCYPPIYNVYPPVTNVTVVNQLPLEPPVQPALVDGVDLELLDLRLVDVGDVAKNLGPRYRITFRNRGTLPAGNFQVMLLASSDGTPKPGLPSGISEVAGLASGQLLTADVRLTVTPDLATLGTLIVALDSATQIAETEEGNNVAVLDRARITQADLATTGIPQ